MTSLCVSGEPSLRMFTPAEGPCWYTAILQCEVLHLMSHNSYCRLLGVFEETGSIIRGHSKESSGSPGVGSPETSGA